MLIDEDAVQDALDDTAIRECVSRLNLDCGDEFVVTFVSEVYDADWGPEGVPGQYREYVERKTVGTLLRQIAFEGRYTDLETVRKINTLQEFAHAITDLYDEQAARVFTAADYEKHKAEEERKQLEQSAKSFAHSFGAQVNTMEFVQGVKERLERVRANREAFNGGEQQMERWAECRAVGVGAEGFHFDGNFQNGRYNYDIQQLEAILAWLERECPLLMASVREKELAHESTPE